MVRKSILIVDDEEMSRAILKQMFEEEYDIIEAENGKEAIKLAFSQSKNIAAILLDLMMPELNGFQVLQVLVARKLTEHIPVVMITGQKDNKTEMTCYSLGASAVVNKPYVAATVTMQVKNIIEMFNRADSLERKASSYQKELAEEKQKLSDFYDKLVDVVANLVEFRNLESGEHIQRVRNMSKILADRYMALYPDCGLTKDKIEYIVRAAALHDIGKIAIPDYVLLKPGKLTEEEKQIMKSHTTRGCEILNLMIAVQNEQQLKVSMEVCRYHHEKYDGSGYPEGLKGDAIPLAAQIVSIVDCYDALCNERVYKEAYDKETAFDMIVGGKCGAFSPRILECFKQTRYALEEILDDSE